MKYLIIASVFIIILLVGCIQPNDVNIHDKNDTNDLQQFNPVCGDPTKRLVIVQVSDGEIWDCV